MSQKRGKMPDHMRRQAEQQKPGTGTGTGSEDRERMAGGKHVGGNGGPMRKERDSSSDPNRDR